MEVVIAKNELKASEMAGEIVKRTILTKSNAVLALPTGKTPLKLYEELVRFYKEEGLSYTEVITFNLDEYVGLKKEHPASYSHYMNDKFFKHVDIHPDLTHFPTATEEDFQSYANQYEEEIKRVGGIDLLILGIGEDGHIAFNEPSSSLSSRTRIKTLTEKTLKNNLKLFKNKKSLPKHVMTMGIATILEAKKVILLAFGEKKSKIIKEAIEGPITSFVPASSLQMHPNVTIFLDEKAASKLKLKNYYKFVYTNKPKAYKYE